MSQALIEKGETVVSSWQRLEFDVLLADMEHLTIMACKNGYRYDSTNGWVANTDKSKFRLTGLSYKLNDDGAIQLNNLRGNFFTKANRVGAREVWVTAIDQETLDQLPKEVLAHAEEHFNKVVLPELQSVINTGILVTTKGIK
jgi:hypothetical protein